MKINELVNYVYGAADAIFIGRNVIIKVTPIRYNGVCLSVKERTESGNFNQIGHNLKVYGLSGKENISIKIKRWYEENGNSERFKENV